jgi:hypothetical protein
MIVSMCLEKRGKYEKYITLGAIIDTDISLMGIYMLYYTFDKHGNRLNSYQNRNKNMVRVESRRQRFTLSIFSTVENVEI